VETSIGGTDDQLMTPKQAAEYVGMELRAKPYALGTIYNLRSEGVMAPPDEIRRGRPRWRKSTLDAWVRTQIQTVHSGAGRQSREEKTQ